MFNMILILHTYTVGGLNIVEPLCIDSYVLINNSRPLQYSYDIN